MSLFPHQQRCIDWLAGNPKAYIGLEPGLGKTAIAIIEARFPALIVLPGFLIPNWLREIEMWRPGTRVAFDGEKTHCHNPDIFIQSYDTLSRRLPDAKLYRTLIMDESHYAKNPKAKRTKACMKLAKEIPFVRLLSGTPFLGRPIELWAMASAMSITRMDMYTWGFYYCAGYIDRFGRPDFRGCTESKLPELRELIRPHLFRMKKSEAISLPPKLRRMIVVNAPLDVREREYDVKQIADAGSPVPFVGLAEVMHYHGLGKVPAAINHIIDVLDQEEKILVFAHHRDVIDSIVAALKQREIEAEAVTGETNRMQRDRLTRSFQHGKLRVLVGNMTAMGTGLTLTASRYVIFVEASWSAAVNEQCESRVERIGQTLPTQIDYLVADGSIDSQLVEVALKKSRISAEVLGDNHRSKEDMTNEVKTDSPTLITAARAFTEAFGNLLVLLVALFVRSVAIREGKTPIEENVAVADAVEQEAKSRRGRPPKAAAAEPMNAPVADAPKPETPKQPAYTEVDVKEVLRKVQEIDKLEVKRILSALGASNMATLHKSRYYEAIDKGNAFIAKSATKQEAADDDLGI